jgi:hypothetical protein
MSKFNQDQAARRTSAANREPLQSSRYSVGYDCELPSIARTELIGQRRPPIPPLIDRPIPVAPKPGKRRAIYVALAALCGVALLAPAINAWRQTTAERAKTTKAILQPTPAPQPSATSALTPGPASSWRHYRNSTPGLVSPDFVGIFFRTRTVHAQHA